MDNLRNLFTKFGLGLTLSLGWLGADADVTTLPVKDINGRSCHYYLVQPKETIYSITHKLGISKEELLKYNPGASDGLKSGEILVFPANQYKKDTPSGTREGEATSSRANAKPSPASGGARQNTGTDMPSTHTVQKGETLFGIARRYNLVANDLLSWNPEASNGLKAGMVLRLKPDATAQNPSVPGIAVSTGNTHTIKEGETLYQISKKYGVSVNDLLSLNPQLDRNRYSAGQIITLPRKGQLVADSVTPTTTEPQQPATDPDNTDVKRGSDGTITRYLVKNGETLYSISRAHGVTVQQLEAANPGLTVLRKGMTLIIPDVEAREKAEEAKTDSIEKAQETPNEAISQPETPNINTTPAEDGSRPEARDGSLPTTFVTPDQSYQNSLTGNIPVKVAVALPFMASSETRPKSSQLFTEFYKGLLIAVDSLKNNGRPIHLYAYDTCDNMDTLRNIMKRPEMREMSAIIAPEDEAQMREIAFFGRSNNIPVINAFVVKDNSYRFNPSVMQCNIPHTDMYDKAIREMTAQLNGATPVILNSKDGVEDKAEYIGYLRKALDDKNIAYETINYSGQLKGSDLAALRPTDRYVFIPMSGKQSEFNKIAPALVEFRDRSGRSDAVKVIGYPEWITFRGESLDNLHKLNASVYSRFFSVPEDGRTIAFDQTYSRWYGAPSSNYLPNQGMLGFDLGMYLFKALRAPGSQLDNPVTHTPMSDHMTAYNGVQNGFRFTTLPHAGSVNSVLYYVTYNPGGSVTRKML